MLARASQIPVPNDATVAKQKGRSISQRMRAWWSLNPHGRPQGKLFQGDKSLNCTA